MRSKHHTKTLWQRTAITSIENDFQSFTQFSFCTVSILYGGRIKADFDTIEINLVGSLLYGIIDSSHETNMLV